MRNLRADTVHFLAHGIPAPETLPIPLSFLIVGAGVAVLISFIAMGLFWKSSRLTGNDGGKPIALGVQRVVDASAFRALLRCSGLAATGFAAAAAIAGPADASSNATAGLVYVFFWVGLIPLSLLFGPVWKLVNPLRTIHFVVAKILGVDPNEELVPLPRWIGYWPAALGLFAFTWFELINPSGAKPPELLKFFAVYGGVHLLAAAAFGSNWFLRADAFEAYSSLIGRLAIIGRRGDGRLVFRSPFNGLDGVPTEPGLVAVVCVLFGSTAYDGFSKSTLWANAQQSGFLPPVLLNTLALLVTIGISAGLYIACTSAATSLGTTERRALPRAFAHSMIPIFIGYATAHYFTLLIIGGQQTLILATDPLGNGSDLLGTAQIVPNFALVSVTATAFIQVAAVVIGHVLGVVAAHDRAARIFPPDKAVTGQIPLVVLMVGFTIGGLSLLFSS